MQRFKLRIGQQMAGQCQAGRHAHHPHQRGKGHGQHGVGCFQRRFGQRVTQKIRILIPQFLVQQVDHRAARAGGLNGLVAGFVRSLV